MNLKRVFSIFCFLTLFEFFFFPKSASAMTEWVKHGGNPVIDVGASGSWDASNVDSPSVFFDGSTFRMWYGGYDGSKWRIGYAVSSDGINWAKQNNPVLDVDPPGSWEIDVHEPTVIYDGIYKMWYNSGHYTGERGMEQWRIRYATSSDGINWVKYPDPVLRGNPAGWDKEGIAHPYVTYDAGIYKMWFAGRNIGDVWQLGYATSSDGVNWNKNPNPIQNLYNHWAGGPSILKTASGYLMWYHDSSEIRAAVSSDGINWANSPENMFLRRGSNNDFDDLRLIGPAVLKKDNAYKMWYTGYDGSRWRIGYATMVLEPTLTPTPPPSSFLSVPYFSQRDNRWGTDEYDHANNWITSDQENTIDWWGCALTSGAMVARYFGIDKTPYGEELTPGSLNKWMKDQNDANFRNGAMNWQLLSRMSAETANLFGTIKLDAFSSKINNNFPKLDEILGKSINSFPGLPAILQVTHPISPSGKHFLVAKGKVNGTYGINDPYDNPINPIKNLLSIPPYNNNFDQLVWYEPTHSNLSTIFLVVDKDVNIDLVDQNGQSLGEQLDLYPLTDNENGANSGEILKMIYFEKPLSGNYTINLSSDNLRTYQLDTYLYDRNAEVNMQTFSGVIGPNDSDLININFDLENSQNSQTDRVVNYETFRNDVNSSYILGWINNKGSENSLLVKINGAEKASQKGDKKTEENILNALLAELEAQKEKHISLSAYNLFKEDLIILLSQL